MSDGETKGEALEGAKLKAKAKAWNVDLGDPVPEGATLSGRAFDAAVGAAAAHLGDPCLYCEVPARLVAPGPCPKAGDHGAAIISLHRNLERNVNATRIALEKATVAIGTACHDEVREDVKALKSMRFDVDALKRMHETPHAAGPGPVIVAETLGGSCEAGAVERLADAIRLEHPRLLEVAGGARSLAGAAAESIRLLRHERDEAQRQRDAATLNLADKVDRLRAEVDMAHANRQRAQDEADRLRKETMTLAERAGLAEAKVSIAGAKAGAFDREASLKDRLLKALQERDEARVEAAEAREKVEELEVQFAEEQDANDAEEADTKAARAALEAAQADFAKLADVVARFEPMPTGRGLPEVIAAIERMGPARDRFERDRKLLKDDANLVPHLKATLEEALKQRADLEARLVAAETKASSDPEAAGRLAADLATALGERDAARAALAEREARRGPIPLGWTAAVQSDTAALVRALDGVSLAAGTMKRTTYGRAAEVVERLKLDLAQQRNLTAKREAEAAAAHARATAAESRAIEAARFGSEGARLIAEERARQVKAEGFSSDHDDGHRDGALAWAAACYAAPARVYRRVVPEGVDPLDHEACEFVDAFPWDAKWDKRPLSPENPEGFEHHAERKRALVKAGALCAAEVDRLDRALPF